MSLVWRLNKEFQDEFAESLSRTSPGFRLRVGEVAITMHADRALDRVVYQPRRVQIKLYIA